MFIVIYRKHGELNMDTKHIGPFNDHDSAYEHLCTIPAIGICGEYENQGCKHIVELRNPITGV